MSLQSKAMLVTLSISQWNNRIVDRKVTDEVATQYDLPASHRQDRYVKVLLPKAAVKDIAIAAVNIRALHHRYTLPWKDGNIRILPTAKFMDYRKKMAELKTIFENEVSDFLEAYPRWVHQAQEAKKAMFVLDEYPTIDDLRKSYGLEFNFYQIPDSKDFRVEGLDEEQIEEIKEQTRKNIDDTLDLITKNMMDRLTDRLTILHNGLDKAWFKDKTVHLLFDTVSLIEELNVTKIEVVTDFCERILDSLEGLSLANLRSDKEYRKEIQAKIKVLLL